MVGPQYQENRMVQRRGGEAASLGQADAHPVEDHCSYHRKDCCSVSGTLRIPAVCLSLRTHLFTMICNSVAFHLVCPGAFIVANYCRFVIEMYFVFYSGTKQLKETMRRKWEMTPES